MISRVQFVLGSACSLAAVPGAAPADDATPAPSAGPSPSPAPSASSAPRMFRGHVHGPNGVTRIPEHRLVEWKMEVLDGPEFRLSAYRGKAVFVNVFATWCPPCRAEQPAVVSFARAHPDDTAVIGVDVDEPDDVVRRYRKEFAIPYPIAMHRSRVTVPSIFKDDSVFYPITLVFHPDGTLSCAWGGDRPRAWFEVEREVALR
jgi:thiol-disulfide isomerase/thioredoxin